MSYKAAWEGIEVIQLSKAETRGTSKLCYQCGERLQGSRDPSKRRMLWCQKCVKWFDRDVVATMNIAYKGRSRFKRSKGVADEAMVQELGSKEPIILQVDATKLGHRP